MTSSRTLGFGLGLRPQHYDAILNGAPKVDWFEALTENYLVPGGKPLAMLDRIRERYPMVLHGVSLSIGSTDPLDYDYLKALRALAVRVQPEWISDHLCWTGVAGKNLHDLMPLPFTEDSLNHIVGRVGQVQEYLGRKILIENVSSYLTFKQSNISEWEFLSEIARRADCMILLDVNNIYVSAFNHGFSAEEYIAAIPVERVQQIHLAGHSNYGTHVIDTHDAAIVDPVWRLYETAIQRFGAVATMIERDDHIPPLGDLVQELDIARHVARSALKLKAVA